MKTMRRHLHNSGDGAIHINKVVAKLKQDQLVTGIWVFELDPRNARALVHYNGFPTQRESVTKPMIDFIFIDMEHDPYDISKLRSFLLSTVSRQEVLAKGNLQPSFATFVRIPSRGESDMYGIIKQVLDVGVHGVVIPLVKTSEEALKIVKMCRYRQPENSLFREPVGCRGAAPGLCAHFWGMSNDDYIRQSDVWPLNPQGNVMVILMIEDVEGVNNIEAIVKTPGVGAVIFGPCDYSFSAGLFGDVEDPEVAAAEKKIKAACDKVGVPLIVFATPNNIDQRIKEKQKMLFIGMDIDLAGGADKILEYLRQNDKGKRHEPSNDK